MNIRIIDTPDGEAPLHIRQAWIGIDLPVHPSIPGTIECKTIGVLVSRPRFTWLNLLGYLGVFLGKRERGYVVDATAAFDRLKLHAPEAEAWWRENTPRLYAHGSTLLFQDKACMVIFRNDD